MPWDKTTPGLEYSGGSGETSTSASKIKKIKKFLRYSKRKQTSKNIVEPVKAIITYGGGVCELETQGRALGIQIEYIGNINIKTAYNKITDTYGENPKHNGWVLAANNETGKLLLYSMGGEPLYGKKTLFQYDGDFKITGSFVAGGNLVFDAQVKQFKKDFFNDIKHRFNDMDKKFDNLGLSGKSNRAKKKLTGYEVPDRNKKVKRSKINKKQKVKRAY